MSIVKRVCNLFKTTKPSPEATTNPNLISDELFDNINYDYVNLSENYPSIDLFIATEKSSGTQKYLKYDKNRKEFVDITKETWEYRFMNYYQHENKLQKKIRSETFEKLNASFRIKIANFVYNYMNLIKFDICGETFMLITQSLTDKKFAALDYTSFLDYFYYNCKYPLTAILDEPAYYDTPEYKRYKECIELKEITNNDCDYSVSIPRNIYYIHKIYLPKSATNVRIKMNDVEYPITICERIRGSQFMGFVEYSVNILKHCIPYSKASINFTDIKTPQIYIVQTVLPFSMLRKFMELSTNTMFKFEDNVIVGRCGATKNYSGSHELKKIIIKKVREIDEYMNKNRGLLSEYQSYYEDYYKFPEK